MNYFKIGADQYKVEIRAEGAHFIVALCLLCDGGRWAQRSFRGFWAPSRPAARRALKRELERLATDWHGKRANWTVARSEPWTFFHYLAERATERLAGSFDALADTARGAGRAMAALHEPLHKFAEVAR